MKTFRMLSKLLTVCIVVALMVVSTEAGLSEPGQWLPGADLTWHTPIYRNNQWNVQINVPCFTEKSFQFKLYKDGKLISSKKIKRVSGLSPNHPVDVTIDDTSGPFDSQIVVQAEIIYPDNNKRRSKPLRLSCTPWGIIGICIGFGACIIALIIYQIQKRKESRLPQNESVMTTAVTAQVPVIDLEQGY